MSAGLTVEALVPDWMTSSHPKHFLLEVVLLLDWGVLSSWRPKLLVMLGQYCLEVEALRAQEEWRWTQGCWNVHLAQGRVCVRHGHHPDDSSLLHLVEFQMEAAHRPWSPF